MIFFVIILLLACGLLGLIILVQNPKGGGLAGNVAGFSNQFMGDTRIRCGIALYIFYRFYPESHIEQSEGL
jgi:protein translocase SecG subunit